MKYLNEDEHKMLVGLIEEFHKRLLSYGAKAYLLTVEFDVAENTSITSVTSIKRYASISHAIGLAEYSKERLIKEKWEAK